MVVLPIWAFILCTTACFAIGIFFGTTSNKYDDEGLTPAEKDEVGWWTRWNVGVAEQDDGPGAVNAEREARIRKGVITAVKQKRGSRA